MFELSKTRKSIKDILVGITGASVAQVISFLLVPVVARLFNPVDFGGAALFLAILAVLSSIASLRYEQAIVLPDTDNEAKALTCVSLIILGAVVLGAVALVLVLLFFPVNSERDYDSWLVLLPIFLLIAGVGNILLSWSTRLGQFSRIASTEMASTLGTSGSRIGFGFLFGSSVLGLLMGTLIGYGLKVLMLWAGAKKKLQALGKVCRLPAGTLSQTIRNYRDFPFFSAPTGFVREFKENIPLFGLTFLFSIQAAGFYGMASRIVRLPVAVISMPVRRVFIQRASKAINNGARIRKLLIKTTVSLFIIGLPPFLLIILFGAEIFSWLLGENWRNAGLYAEVLALWLFSIFVLTPSAATFVVVRSQHLWLYLQVFGSVLGILVFGISGFIALDILEALALFVAVQILLNFAIFFVALFISSGRNSVGKAALSEIELRDE